MDPYLVPSQTYERVFGTLMPGGMTSANADALQAARELKKSVLDFGMGDLQKLRSLAPSSEWERLDAHEDAIRALERELDAQTGDPTGCGAPDTPEEFEPFLDGSSNRIGNGVYSTTESNTRDDEIHQQIARLHFSVIRAAFECDLTRTVTFQFSPGTNHVSFLGMYPGEPDSIKMHHPLSHDYGDPNAPEFLTNVDTWYSELTSEFLQALKDTPDVGGGNILDNTFVPYVTEVARADHSFREAPFVVFGGPGVRVQGDRFKRYSPRRGVNDMWLAAAQAFDVPMSTLGDSGMYQGPLDILI
jgi:hypothetical protein